MNKHTINKKITDLIDETLVLFYKDWANYYKNNVFPENIKQYVVENMQKEFTIKYDHQINYIINKTTNYIELVKEEYLCKE